MSLISLVRKVILKPESPFMVQLFEGTTRVTRRSLKGQIVLGVERAGRLVLEVSLAPKPKILNFDIQGRAEVSVCNLILNECKIANDKFMHTRHGTLLIKLKQVDAETHPA